MKQYALNQQLALFLLPSMAVFLLGLAYWVDWVPSRLVIRFGLLFEAVLIAVLVELARQPPHKNSPL